MGKLKINQKGFSGVEAFLVLVIAVLISVVGYVVYMRHQKATTASVTATAKTSSSSSTKSATNPYEGWQTYTDSHFTFKYPRNWKAVAPGSQGVTTSDVSVIGAPLVAPPYFQIPALPTKFNVNFSLFTSLADPSGCNSGPVCTVEIATPLKIKNIPNARLVVFRRLSDDVSIYEVVDITNQKVGDNSFQEGLSVNGNTYQLIGCSVAVVSNGIAGEPVCGDISNYLDFKNSSDYRNLVNVLNSLTIN